MSEVPLGQTRQPQPTSGSQTTSEHGILGVPDVGFRLYRAPASADLADLVERHWLVRWDLPAGRRAAVSLLPHPCVNLVYDRGQVTIAGVGRERFRYEYEGAGRVFGTKFRPGGFLPFLRRPVGALTDQYLPLAALWGTADADRLACDLTAAPAAGAR